MKIEKCCVVGLGYIGLPTAIISAISGFQVIGVDTNCKLVEDLNNGLIHILEPDIELEFEKICKKKTFKAQDKPCNSDVFIIAVPTPFKYKLDSNPIPDISFVLDAVESIIPYLKKNNLIILESTSPVGTTEKLARKIYKETSLKPGQIKIAYCPERVLPGKILKEIIENDRVIGGINKESALAAKDFYLNFSKGNFKLTDTKTAELVKLTENAFRDVNIAFANELSMICSELDIDTNELINIANSHPRVNILNPGPGVGGHCIAVDPWFIVSKVPDKSILIKTAREVNIKKTLWVTDKIKSSISKFENTYKRRPNIGCFGLTFKPDVDDIRESPAIKIIKNLIQINHNVVCCDPNVNFVDNLRIENSSYLLENCEILIFLVNHKEFKSLNLDSKKYIILDFC